MAIPRGHNFRIRITCAAPPPRPTKERSQQSGEWIDFEQERVMPVGMVSSRNVTCRRAATRALTSS